MQELAEILEWSYRQRPTFNSVVVTLPGPEFEDHRGKVVSFSTNNYLALAGSPRMKAAAIEGIQKYGVGNCESRLLSGNLEIYNAVEERLAKSKGKEAAILFPTGYMANLGALSSLPRILTVARAAGYVPTGSINYAYFSDAFNHVSIKEGVRSARVPRASYKHVDLNHLHTLLKRSSATRKIIVTDGVFSRDGDLAPIPDLLEIAERFDAYLYVDDAHGSGVLGQSGHGILEHFDIRSDRIIYMGTLSKAYGSIGGFVAGNRSIVEALRLICTGYGFSSTLPPDQALAVLTALDIVEDEPWRRGMLWTNQAHLAGKLQAISERSLITDTPIIPLIVGNELRAEKLASALRDRGIYVDAIRFPAVPLGTARIRIQLNAGHTREHINRLVSALRDNRHFFS